MDFFKKPYKIRRYSTPVYVNGYASIPYTDFTLPMDVQTTEDVVKTAQDGSQSVQKLKVFCDREILVESEVQQQRQTACSFRVSGLNAGLAGLVKTHRSGIIQPHLLNVRIRIPHRMVVKYHESCGSKRFSV